MSRTESNGAPPTARHERHGAARRPPQTAASSRCGPHSRSRACPCRARRPDRSGAPACPPASTDRAALPPRRPRRPNPGRACGSLVRTAAPPHRTRHTAPARPLRKTTHARRADVARLPIRRWHRRLRSSTSPPHHRRPPRRSAPRTGCPIGHTPRPAWPTPARADAQSGRRAAQPPLPPHARARGGPHRGRRRGPAPRGAPRVRPTRRRRASGRRCRTRSRGAAQTGAKGRATGERCAGTRAGQHPLPYPCPRCCNTAARHGRWCPSTRTSSRPRPQPLFS